MSLNNDNSLRKLCNIAYDELIKIVIDNISDNIEDINDEVIRTQIKELLDTIEQERKSMLGDDANEDETLMFQTLAYQQTIERLFDGIKDAIQYIKDTDTKQRLSELANAWCKDENELNR